MEEELEATLKNLEGTHDKQQFEEEVVQHLNNPVTDIKPIVKEYLTSVKSVKKEGNKFYLSDGDAVVEVRVVSDEIIRVRLAPHGVFLADFSYAVEQVDKKVTTFQLEDTADAYLISTNTITCKVRKDNFLISFICNKTGIVTSSDASPMHWEENSEFGGFYVYATKQCQSDENFFGLGDKSGNMNLRGRKFQNWNTDFFRRPWIYSRFINNNIAHF